MPDINSAPIAIPHSMCPRLIWFAISWTALRPEEQNRLTEAAAVVLGKPAARDAARTKYAALCSLTWSYVSILAYLEVC